jgi:signal peptidase II
VPRQRLARRINARVLVWALAVIALDALSKSWARHYLGSKGRHVWGPLWLRLNYNGGISFSLNHSGAIVTTLFVLAIVLVVMFVAFQATPGLATVGFGLLLGGGVANEIDRLVRVPHQVTDFISVGSFPVFNVADAGVTVGFCVLMLALLRGSTLVQR